MKKGMVRKKKEAIYTRQSIDKKDSVSIEMQEADQTDSVIRRWDGADYSERG